MRIAAIVVCLVVALIAAPARAQDLSGWWRADLSHNGETQSFYLHFDMDGERQRARFSIPVVRMHEVFVGGYRVNGDAVEMPGLGWRLTLAADGASFSGVMPPGLVTVYEIPAHFVRSAPAPAPPPFAPARDAPAPAWTADVGAPVWAGLAHDGRRQRLYVADEGGGVHALSARDGAPIWRIDLQSPVRATPTLSGDRLYVASDAALTALDARTGRELWSHDFGAERAPRLPMSDGASQWDHYSASAVIDRGVLYAASRDGCVYALRARDGREFWRRCTENLVTSTPALTRDAVYVGGFDGRAYKLARADGAILWSYDTHAPVPRDLTVAGGRVLVGSRSYDLIALDAQGGQPLWTRYFWFSWIDSPAVLADGAVYVGSSDGLAVQAFDPVDGRRLWSAPVPGWSWGAPGVGARTIYAGAAGGAPYLAPRDGGFAAIDRASGALNWLHRAPPAGEGELYGFAAAPVVSGARVFAADLAGRVYAFDDPQR